VESILALQARAAPDTRLPLAIMTSGDTHERTEALLRDNANFGMAPGQVTLLKQEKARCSLCQPWVLCSPARRV
jgi:UDP-sugar pyrophosphorylase